MKNYRVLKPVNAPFEPVFSLFLELSTGDLVSKKDWSKRKLAFVLNKKKSLTYKSHKRSSFNWGDFTRAKIKVEMNGKMGRRGICLKSERVLNCCPLFFISHLVTAVSDMVLKSRLFTHPLLCVRSRRWSSFAAPLPCWSETVATSLWQLSLDCQGLGNHLTAPWLFTDQTLPVMRGNIMKPSMLWILLVSTQ